MTGYLLRRVVLLLPTLVGLTLLVFFVVRFLPGDAIDQLLSDSASRNPQIRKQLEDQYRLNGSVGRQYVEWVGSLARGDLGRSIVSSRPVTEQLKARLPVTIELGVLALIIAQSIALPVGILGAIRQDTAIDYLARSLAIALLTVPSFWLGLLAITYGFAWFGWTPPLSYSEIWQHPLSNLRSLWVPALILGGGLAGAVMRVTRSSMLDVLRQDYVRTARAKGMAQRLVILRHALRNAAIPVVTVIGLQVPVVVGGTVIIERIFSLPGIGSYLLESVNHRDYPVVQAIVLVSATVVLATNLVVDLSYPLIDPRVGRQ